MQLCDHANYYLSSVLCIIGINIPLDLQACTPIRLNLPCDIPVRKDKNIAKNGRIK